jgi:heme/copper-type cytochrome/quinol oxidase subunit 1
MSCIFHVNCGTRDALSSLNESRGTSYSYSFFWLPNVYYSFSGHNVLPTSFRWQLWFLTIGNLMTLVLFQWVGVLGYGRRVAQRKWPLNRFFFKT